MSALGCTAELCSSPLLQMAVLYSKPSCHPAVLLSPESAGPSEGQAGKKLPSSLSNSPLCIYGWANTCCFYHQDRVVSSRVFLTEHFLRPDRQTVLSLPLSGAVFCLFTWREHGYNTFLCQQGNLHTTRSTELAGTFL